MTDRERLIVAIERAKEQSDEAGLDCIVVKFKEANLIIELLKEQPKQKHGHWIVSGEPPLMIKTCSECDVRFFHHPTGELERFCANCGARMDEEVEQE